MTALGSHIPSEFLQRGVHQRCSPGRKDLTGLGHQGVVQMTMIGQFLVKRFIVS